MDLNKPLFNIRSLCGIFMIIVTLISIVYKAINDKEIKFIPITIVFMSAIYLIIIGYNRKRHAV